MNKRRTYEFLQLTNTISYPPAKKADLSTAHSIFIDQVIKDYDGTRKTKEHVMHVFNCITYMYISGDSLPNSWKLNDPLHTYTEYADDFLEDTLADYFIHVKDVDWIDVPIHHTLYAELGTNSCIIKGVTAADESTDTILRQVPKSDPVVAVPDSEIKFTDKSDLYIQPPVVPRFDVNTPVASGNIDNTLFAVYTSYPEVPVKQNEISATTDVNLMTEKDLLRLFPSHLIRTRAECMYQECNDIELDDKLGLILPIAGYTSKQLKENIIKYPHIFKLLKDIDGSLDSFYSTIEIDNELHKVSEIWSQLPESKQIPYTKEFVKEYVVRRYLLERDIKGIKHRYKLYGTLDPFLTLFTTSDDYAALGYTDPIQLAHSCVVARVSYKRSRNPVLRRLVNV